MLIARAPVRISFAGGGTDFPAYYRRFGGCVISTSINRYFYTVITRASAPRTQIISADYKSFFSIDHQSLLDAGLIWEGNLALPRAILEHFGPGPGIDIFLASEIPPGTGLGSSSAAAVCMVKAFSTSHARTLNKAEIAELASYIEIEKLGMPIGKQDQYASAFGGLNRVDFHEDDRISVTPLNLNPAFYERLQDWLLLFYTGVSRHSTTILSKQKASMQNGEKPVIDSLQAIKDLTRQVEAALLNEDLPGFAALLDEGWQRKQRLASNVSNSTINDIYNQARQAGALGGKITGAGGGGFLLLCCPPENQEAVTARLTEAGLKQLDFRFEQNGADLVLNNLS